MNVEVPSRSRLALHLGGGHKLARLWSGTKPRAPQRSNVILTFVGDVAAVAERRAEETTSQCLLAEWNSLFFFWRRGGSGMKDVNADDGADGFDITRLEQKNTNTRTE